MFSHCLISPPRLGTDTVFFDCLVLSHKHQRAAARIREEVVCYDYRQGIKAPLKSHMIDVMRGQEEKEKGQREKWEARRMTVEDEITKLEQSTWAMPGAKEDLGSAQGNA